MHAAPLSAESSSLRAPPGIRNTQTDDQAFFSQALAKAGSTRPTPGKDPAREAAESLIAQALVLPVLKQFRSTNQAAPPFAPSSAERTFRAIGDSALAQKLVQGDRWPLVDQLARRLRERLQGAAPGADA